MGNVKPVKMGKTNVYVARSAEELYDIIGVEPKRAAELEFRFQLTNKIIDAVKRRKLTHEQAAKLSGTSRTRMTAILNGNMSNVSSDLLLRVLYSLGYQAKVSFSPVKMAA